MCLLGVWVTVMLFRVVAGATVSGRENESSVQLAVQHLRAD